MRRVITYGTFDLFHKGHYNILKRAKEEGDYLIVGVTGDSYDVERGKMSVQDSLATRIENVKNTGFADQIIVEEYLGQKIPDIIRYNVDVFVIGSDWKGKFDHLSKYCEVKYVERTKNISSTMLREQSINIYRFGIVTDDLDDNDAVSEPLHVSGFHVECVYSDDAEIADGFCNKFELDSGYSDYAEFLDNVDIVYIKTTREKRADYIRAALNEGKHVICEAPFTLDSGEEKELEELSVEKGVFLLHNVSELYFATFGQLLWMTRGNLIGDIVSVKCSISKELFGVSPFADFYDLAYYPLCVIVKLLGTEFHSVTSDIVRNEDGSPAYGLIKFLYNNCIATAEISMDISINGGMEIVGRNGSIYVPDDWWQIGYFRLKKLNEPRSKRYSFNFEGNGFRYLLQALLAMIRDEGDIVTKRITAEESASIQGIFREVLHD